MVFFLAIFISRALAQQAVCESGTNQVPFNACVRNTLYGPASGTLFTTPEAACSEIPAGTYQSYQCLCEKYGVIVFCFESFCIGNTTVETFISARTGYCAFADTLRPTITSSATLAPSSTSSRTTLLSTAPAASSPAAQVNSLPANSFSEVLVALAAMLI